MADLTLNIHVAGTDQIKTLDLAIEQLGLAGDNASKRMSSTAKQADAMEAAFTRLGKELGKALNPLSAAVTQLKGSIAELGQAFNTMVAAGEAGPRQMSSGLVDANGKMITLSNSARKARAELQKLYEAQLVEGGSTKFTSAGLRNLRTQGVSLTPGDRDTLRKVAEQEKFVRDLDRVYDENVKNQNEYLNAAAANAGRQATMFKDSRAQAEQQLNAQTAAIGRQANLMTTSQAQQDRYYNQQLADLGRRATLMTNSRTTEARHQAQVKRLTDEEINDNLAAIGRRASLMVASRNADDRAQQTEAQRRARWMDVGLRATERNMAEEARLHARREAQDVRNAQARTRIIETTQRWQEQSALREQRLASVMRGRDARFAEASQDEQLRVARRAFRELEAGGSIGEINQKYGALAGALAQSASSYSDLKQRAVPATQAIHNSSEAMRSASMAAHEMHTTLRGAAGGMGAIWLTWGRPLVALWAGFAGAVVIRDTIKYFAEFENELRTIQGLSQSATEEITALSDAALELGRSSSNGPRELVKGLRTMTQAGFSPGEAVSALPTVDSFARAGDMELGPAAESLIGISSAFGKAKSGLSEVANVISKAAAMSQTSIEGMTEAMKTASVVAEQYNVDIYEVSATLATMSARNIDRSAAGTALRNVVNELYTPSEKAKRLMDALNFSAYNADGSLKNLTQSFTEMKAVVEKLNPKAQKEFFDVFFGERGGKAGSAILSDVTAFVNKVENLRENSKGFVDSAALEKNLSLLNQAKSTVNAYEGALIRAGRAGSESFTELLGVLRDLANSFEFQQGLSSLVYTFGQVSKAIVENISAITTIIQWYVAARVALVLARSALGLYARAVDDAAAASARKAAAVAADTLATAANTAVQTTNTAAHTAGAVAATALATRLAGWIPVIGWVATALGVAAVAWDLFREKKEAALAEPSGHGKTLKTELEDLVARAQKQAADAKRAVENNTTLAQETERGAFERRMQQIIDERDAGVARIKSEVFTLEDTEEGKRYADARKNSGPQRSADPDADGALIRKAHERFKQDQERRAKELFDMKQEELHKQAVLFANYLEAQRSMENSSTILERRAKENALKAGKDALPNIDPTRDRAGYGNAILAEQKFDEQAMRTQVQRIEKDTQDRTRLLEARRRGDLIGEAQYQQELEDLQQTGFDKRIAFLKEYLSGLGEYQSRMEEAINKKFKDPAARSDQIRTLRADLERQRTSAADLQAEAERDKGMATALSGIRAESDTRREVLGMADMFDKALDVKRKWAKESAEIENNLRDRSGLQQAKEELDADLSGMSVLEREYAQQRLQIQKNFYKERNDAREHDDAVNRLAMLDRVERDVQAELDAYTRRKAAARSDPKTGIRKASRSLADEGADTAKLTEDAFLSTYQNMESALTTFVETGKFKFSDLATSIISDISRIALKAMMSPIFNQLALSLSGGGFGGTAPMNFSLPIGELLATAGVGHTGGIVGSLSTTRRVPMSTFAGAPRFHDGGAIGKDEVPIIAQRGERVLSRNQNEVYERGMLNSSSVIVNQTNNIGPGVSRGEVLSALKQNKAQTKQEIQDGIRRGQRGWSRDR